MNKFLYWGLQLTWGLPANIVGCLVFLVCLFFIPSSTIGRYKNGIVTCVGKDWGGFSCGGFIFADMTAGERTFSHEYGHSIQNIILGPLWLFIIAIPSAIRYHYICCKEKTDYNYTYDYDSIWFEGWATKIGKKIK